MGLYLVEAGADGLTLAPDAIVDLTRDQASLTFESCAAVELAAPGDGLATLERALPAMLAVVSADMVGAGEWLLQTTVEYARTRTRFDRPLGFFQAVKHPLVKVMMGVDRARSLTYNAACAVDHEPDRALRYARMAKSEAGDMAVTAASRAVQFTGVSASPGSVTCTSSSNARCTARCCWAMHATIARVWPKTSWARRNEFRGPPGMYLPGPLCP